MPGKWREIGWGLQRSFHWQRIALSRYLNSSRAELPHFWQDNSQDCEHKIQERDKQPPLLICHSRAEQQLLTSDSGEHSHKGQGSRTAISVQVLNNNAQSNPPRHRTSQAAQVTLPQPPIVRYTYKVNRLIAIDAKSRQAHPRRKSARRILRQLQERVYQALLF